MQPTYQWQDVTAQFYSIRKDLSLMQLIKQDQIHLQDCMQAQQINDDKMDPKFDINYQHTIQYKLENKLVHLPKNLNLRQIANIFANIIQLQGCIMQGQPLGPTIYTFAYLYDRKIFQDSYLFTAIIQSIHTFGSYQYDLIKQSCSTKQDDVTMPTFSFSKNLKSHDEIVQIIIQAQKKFQAQYKKNQDKNSFNFVLNALRLRRSIHSLCKNLGISFDSKNQKKIQADLQGTKKKLVAVQQVKFIEENQLLPGVFFSDISKTLKVHFGPKPLRLISLVSSLQQIRNAIEQLQILLPTPTKISQIKNRAQILQSKAYNGWSKSYIKSNLFAKQNYIFSTVKTQQALTADINDWVHLSQNIKQNDKYQNLIKTGAPVISQTIYRLLGNSMRWQWQCSKIYQDYNILIHMANQVDATAAPVNNKQLYIASWFYYYGLQLMVKQLLVGFQINLYQLSQLKYVFYVVQNVLGISHRNGNLHIRKLDKSIFQNFNEGNFNKKMKKKFNTNQQFMFSNFIFKKGLYLYFRALFKILCILHAKKLIDNKFQSTQQIRVKNRFRIFKNILFMKTIQYTQYKKTVDQVCSKQAQYLNQSLEELKQVKNLYKLLTTQLEQGQTFFKQRQDAQILMKLSVKASLIVMTLKMNGGVNKNFGINVNGRFPQYTMV